MKLLSVTNFEGKCVVEYEIPPNTEVITSYDCTSPAVFFDYLTVPHVYRAVEKKPLELKDGGRYRIEKFNYTIACRESALVPGSIVLEYSNPHGSHYTVAVAGVTEAESYFGGKIEEIK